MKRSLLEGDGGGVSSWSTADATVLSSSPSPSSSKSRLAQWWSLDSAPISHRSVSVLCLLLTVSLVTLCALAIALAVSRSGTTGPPTPPPTPPPSLASSSSSTGSSPPSDPAMAFALQLHLSDLMVHIRNFQTIANISGGSRVVSGVGYNRSVDYVVSALSSQTNFNVQRQFFTIERWQVLTAALTSHDSSGGGREVTWAYGTDFMPITNSGKGGLNFDNSSIVLIPNGGCEEADWAANQTVALRVALVERVGSCTFTRQSQLAVLYRAIGLVVYNGAANRSILTTSTVTAYTAIPVFLVTYDVGIAFLIGSQNPDFFVTLTLLLNSTTPLVVANVIADTSTGDSSNTVVVGSHLDGAAAGAGINDNASGSSASLAIALAVHRMINTSVWTLPNRIRFIWFGAEESGLYGSRYHVQQAALPNRLPGDRISDYAAMLNYDSIASPNGYYAVYDAQDLPSATPSRALNGSRVVSSLHFSYFQQQGLPSDGTGMGGGSDYVGFLEAGIACGGLYGGLTEVKTRDMRDRYEAILGPGRGGIANAQLDPCYHRYCDDQQNINQPAYLDMSRSAAFTAASLALQPQLRRFLQYPTSAP